MKVMGRLERTERMMVRWMSGIHLKRRTASAELNRCVKTTQTRLEWLGHVERKKVIIWFHHVSVKTVKDGGSRGRKTSE